MATVAQNLTHYAKELTENVNPSLSYEGHLCQVAKREAVEFTIDDINYVETYYFKDESKLIVSLLQNRIDVEVVA